MKWLHVFTAQNICASQSDVEAGTSECPGKVYKTPKYSYLYWQRDIQKY